VTEVTQPAAIPTQRPRIPIIALVVLILLWMAPPVVARVLLGSWDEAGKLGDSFGPATSLFSGIALIGVAYTAWKQHTDATLTEMRNTQQQALATSQIYQLALATHLQSTRAIIAEHRLAITQLNPAITEVPVAETQLHALIDSIRVTAASNPALRKNQDELIERLSELITLQQELKEIRNKLRSNNGEAKAS
jgi:hypothetical protein